MAWRSPLGELSFVAWGCERERVARGSEAGQGLRSWYSSLFELETRPAGIPRVVGGLPFSSGGAEGPWDAARLWCPSALVVRRKNESIQCIGDVPERAAPSPEGGSRRLDDDALWVPEPSPERYEEHVLNAVTAIRGGQLAKVVLARSTTLRAPSGVFSAAATARAMSASFPAATVYAVALPSGDVLCGATPELIATVSDGVLRTQAVAGTGRSAALLESSKDRHEHQLVVADIVTTLGAAGVDVVHPSTPELVQSGDMLHLVTPIEGRLPRGLGVLDIVTLLHPTAALCGAPRAEAMRWITAHEELDRGWYGGPLGWVDGAGNGTFVVALRCAELAADRRHVRCFAGAGIVNDSEPPLERRETELKMAAAASCLEVMP